VYEHLLERRVSFVETDRAEIVHFSNFFRYLEEAEAGLFRSLNLGPLALVWGAAKGGVGWVRSRAELDFFNPARLDDLLTVHVWIAAKTSRGLTLGGRISREGLVLARGGIKTICVKPGPRGLAACRIPPALDQALEVAPWAPGWPPDGSDKGRIPGTPPAAA